MLDLEKIFKEFFQYKNITMVFPIVAPLTPEDHDIHKL
jgi:hypothetical protein